LRKGGGERFPWGNKVRGGSFHTCWKINNVDSVREWYDEAAIGRNGKKKSSLGEDCKSVQLNQGRAGELVRESTAKDQG